MSEGGGGGLCRICGNLGRTGTCDLFSASFRPLRRRIHALFRIRVNPTDCSSMICLRCMRLINRFYKFYKKVINAQKKLSKDLINNLNPSIDANEVLPPQSFEETFGFPTIDERNDSKQGFDLNDCSLHNDPLLNACETDLVSKSEFGLMLNSNSFPDPIETDLITRNSDITSDNAQMARDPNDELANVLNFHYHCDDDDMMECGCGHFNSELIQKPPTPKKPTKIKEKKIKVKVVKPVKVIKPKVKVEKVKKVREKKKEIKPIIINELSLEAFEPPPPENKEDETIKPMTIPNDFPSEIIRDGRLIVKGNVLDDLISRFYNIHCELCNEFPKFSNLTEMMEHYKSVHKIKGYIKCCNAKFSEHRSIYMHMARHIQPSAFECPVCKRTVSRPHSLKLHLQTHLPEAEKPHKCDQCDRRFSHLEGLTSHKVTHIPVEERKKYTCSVCKKVFTLVTSFSTHMRVAHCTAKFLCSECGHPFRRKTELTLHMLTHDKTGKNRVQCKECGFVCKNGATFKIHMKRHAPKDVNCPLCDYTTHRKQQLNIHIRVRHSNVKPHTCVVCLKEFKLKSVLNNHMVQHTGEHKFSCEFCTKTFASPGNYHLHRKRMHPEQYLKYSIKLKKEKFKLIPEKETNDDQDRTKEHEIAREYLKRMSHQKEAKDLQIASDVV